MSFSIEFIDAADEAVAAAVAVLRWDTGLDVALVPPAATRADPSFLQGALLYGAVRFSDTAGLRLPEARRLGVPVLVALQFPAGGMVDPVRLGLLRAAHDPAILGRQIVRAVA
ncbi:hypothetical protein [Methylobacterium crusticola]|uniref:hypothetical protein n=1 Tax=Methylobacterium crusticola TaxID=1697972 RepID=UPI000FFB7FBF|nr:hypothetical protein [Methylobacterium crusticola]